ncbi:MULTISPECIES: plasmid mobilization protein [unclassified Pseudomonas]|uniref:plasmid mobilization protein n=1 Tax=unclassified Pseudomonas TaxID=196821 RepID=UPI000C87D2D1|nr:MULTISPECIES: conjugal transfer protein TraJ [unclassified Pseudomonas]PMU10199.1 conjugal transfer protein TraJ [Pseudomonas sp. FW305-20]PMU19059.1 conjugal transfer protein TraJ [Pseudomonas sp. FW305-122]PMU42379.1 conjugal transfer protein TraJ [Pseudomonas sp. FW305-47B]PMX62762.1 conjugal transfer protein TraJ [Pseudomonas sp. FW305-33]PMX68026.1 conjugal transfer protein TraJ [Pseudomonas sp. FW305-60]
MARERATEEVKPHSRGSRPRRERVEVWVDANEKAELVNKAAQTGLSMAAYLRSVGLNHPVGARADLDAVRELVKVNGDLGRVAGLLKLWLVEKRGQGAKPIDVEAMMKNFRALQALALDLMSRIVYKRK